MPSSVVDRPGLRRPRCAVVLLAIAFAPVAGVLPAQDSDAERIARGRESARARRAEDGDCRSVRFKGLLLQREASKDWKRLLKDLDKREEEFFEAWLEEWQGALLAAGREAGLSYSGDRARFELCLPAAALAFCGEKQGGRPALLSFLHRATAERRAVIEAASDAGDARDSALLAEAARERLEDPGFQRRLDEEQLRSLRERGNPDGIGFASRVKRGRREDLLPVPEQGLPVLFGGQVLIGRSTGEFARLRELSLITRQDESARLQVDGAAGILFEKADQEFTEAVFFFTIAEIGVVEGVPAEDARNPDGTPRLQIRDDFHGHAVRVPSSAGLSKVHLAGNIVSMATWWRLALAPRNRLSAEEVHERMIEARRAFLDRNL